VVTVWGSEVTSPGATDGLPKHTEGKMVLGGGKELAIFEKVKVDSQALVVERADLVASASESITEGEFIALGISEVDKPGYVEYELGLLITQARHR